MSDGLHLNFSTEEASSEARSFDPVPSGKYVAYLTDVDLRECGPNSKNPGKPYWSLEFTVDEGPYAERKLWTNAMLFEGALYTLAQLLKATGNAGALETGNVPSADSLIGSKVVLNVKKVLDKYQMKDASPNDPPTFKNEIKGIAAADTAVSSGSKDSILP